MLPTRWIFPSKWFALMWAAGICLSAAQFAESGATGGDNSSDSAELAIVAEAMNGVQ